METEHSENQEQANSANHAVLPISKMFDKELLRGKQDTPLTSQDIEIIDQLVRYAVQLYNASQIAFYKERSESGFNGNFNRKEVLIDLAEYKRQYFCAANSDGEKEVWVNCFCDKSTRWRTGLVFVLDGGKCYFQMTLNLHTKKVSDFRTNGEA